MQLKCNIIKYPIGCLDSSLYTGFGETIDGCVQYRRPEMSPGWFGIVWFSRCRNSEMLSYTWKVWSLPRGVLFLSVTYTCILPACHPCSISFCSVTFIYLCLLDFCFYLKVNKRKCKIKISPSPVLHLKFYGKESRKGETNSLGDFL